MWSGPRNISTAIMRAWENRPDTVVWDEPLYAFYLDRTGLDHPMAEAVIAAGDPDWRDVVAKILGPLPPSKDGSARVFFQKHMTHHLLPEVERGWMDKVSNCFLIRDPREVIASYAKARAEFDIDDVGVKQQAEIFDYLLARTGEPPVVIDSEELLRNPAGVLEAWCGRLELPFSRRMLEWPAGPRDSDGVWAAHWYANVHDTTGFAPYVKKGFDLPPHLEPMAEACQPLYERLWSYRLTA